MSDRPGTVTSSPPSKPVLSLRVTIAAWGIILAIAFGSLAWFYTRGLTDLYGDALAHMEGARRIFDSLTPGMAQIGSVWLPLFHLLAAPLAVNNHLWRTGLAGSIVSIIAFCGAAWFLFRLGLEMNGNIAAGFVVLAGVLLCPNMLFLVSTPMTEPLAILWSVVTVYFLFRFHVSGQTRWVIGSALAAFLGTMTRYDEWYVLPFAAMFVLLARKDSWPKRFHRALLFSLIAGAGPLLWILHNAYRFGNPLEFYNGPESAQAIYAHQVATTAFRYPTDGSFLVSARYYLEDLKLVIGPWSLELAALGLVAWAVDHHLRSKRAAALLLLVPLPFYVQAMASAAVGLYVPTLLPYSYYNLRYGLEMLPAIALLPSFLLSSALPRKIRMGLLAGCLLILGAQGFAMVRKGTRGLPVVKETILNTPCKSPADQALIRFFSRHYEGKTILMQSGEWVCVAPSLGIPYRKILDASNRRYWLQLPQGPQKWVEWIVRGTGDPIDMLMRAYPHSFNDFEPVYHKAFPRQQSITIYRRKP
ncbi:MAG: glycosyltransferase family 39 protein [Acidobacteria bacterium]|nr:glycosyltransferase family 39 protein [Acidobacteriota bacterium]